MGHDVFISHSAQDKTVADAVCAKLEQEGIRCWIAPRDILAGKDWAAAILEAIEASRVMVIVFSANANASQPVLCEVERAVNKRVIIIPFRIEAITPNKSLEFFLGLPHWLDAVTPPLQKHLASLARTIQSLLRSDSTRAAARPPGVPAGEPERKFHEVHPDEWNAKRPSRSRSFFKRILEE